MMLRQNCFHRPGERDKVSAVCKEGELARICRISSRLPHATHAPPSPPPRARRRPPRPRSRCSSRRFLFRFSLQTPLAGNVAPGRAAHPGLPLAPAVRRCRGYASWKVRRERREGCPTRQRSSCVSQQRRGRVFGKLVESREGDTPKSSLSAAFLSPRVWMGTCLRGRGVRGGNEETVKIFFCPGTTGGSREVDYCCLRRHTVCATQQTRPGWSAPVACLVGGNPVFATFTSNARYRLVQTSVKDTPGFSSKRVLNQGKCP